MIDLWRSEEMELVQLIIPTEIAHKTVRAIGEVGLLQFKDLNEEKSGFQRTFASQVKRCEEMSRKLRYFKEQLTKADIFIPFGGGITDMTFDELEARLEELEVDLLDVTANSERLDKSQSELVELQLVLEKAGSMIQSSQVMSSEGEQEMVLPTSSEEQTFSRLGNITGLVEEDKLYAFERLLFRATRGNMFLRTSPVGVVMDPATGVKKEKVVYIVFFAGERARSKINKICDTFNANRYPFPDEVSKQMSMRSDVMQRLQELQATIDATHSQQEDLLMNIAQIHESCSTQIREEKAIYHTMNKLSVDVSGNALVGQAWMPANAKQTVQQSIDSATSTGVLRTVIQTQATSQSPPTFFRTTKYTEAFQGIPDAYGIARYREVNAAVFSIITFPFLFAVMFGDVGHGILLLLFAALLVALEPKLLKRKLDEIVEIMFGGRYILLLMGLFSIYVGLLYNEAFSIPMTLFGDTKYRCVEDNQQGGFDIVKGVDFRDISKCPGAFDSSIGLQLEKEGSPYAFGFDPVWRGTKTELKFSNSVKSKIAIILGVVHMNAGLLCSMFNFLHSRDFISIIGVLIPQFLYLNCIFGYMCFLIIYKWVAWPYLRDRSSTLWCENLPIPGDVTSYEHPDIPTLAKDDCMFGARAPDIFHVMINMFLEPGNVDCSKECPASYSGDRSSCAFCTENNIYPGQGTIQNLLVLIALVSVPWMLLAKPLVLRQRHRAARQASGYDVVRSHTSDELPQQWQVQDSLAQDSAGGHNGHDDFDFSELFVENMIHTIEYVLGGMSNTASYLRLWALSLAHGELSKVFYEVLLAGISPTTNSVVAIIIATYVWALATFGVLMGMESLGAFLHALRLHWVEFQSKFYYADGYKFVPFNFNDLLSEEQ